MLPLISHHTLQICEWEKLPEIKFQSVILSYCIIQLFLTCWVLRFCVLLIHSKALWVNGGTDWGRSVGV